MKKMSFTAVNTSKLKVFLQHMKLNFVYYFIRAINPVKLRPFSTPLINAPFFCIFSIPIPSLLAQEVRRKLAYIIAITTNSTEVVSCKNIELKASNTDQGKHFAIPRYSLSPLFPEVQTVKHC